MKTARAATNVRPPRPFASSRRAPRNRPEAAAELVRLEYERDRLERDLSMILSRKAVAERALAQVMARSERLSAMLGSDAGACRD